MGGSLDRSNPQRYRASLRVTIVSILANIVLTAAQIAIGILGQSQALVADGIHTLSDLLTDFLVLFALSHGHRDADEEHPYGHARIETAVTLILSIALVAVGIGIAINAGIQFAQRQGFVTPSITTLWIALVTLAAKEVLYHYTLRTAMRFDSDMLRANAWHHRSDAISSLIVVIGIGGTLLGFAYLDSVAAVLVALMIGKIGISLGWPALRELIDTGLSHDDLEKLRSTILSVDGVNALHLLRTRRVGERAMVDVHLIVDDRLSVSEGHQIGEAVRTKLIEKFPIADVVVHIDTEDDSDDAGRENPPLREEVLNRLNRYFAQIPEANRIERITLHYANGRIVAELVLPFSTAPDNASAKALAARFNAAISADRDIRSISLLFR
jgi:cation diffusion facilitator family transporter